MTQISILNGIYVARGDWRTSYPRNLVPVPKSTVISVGFLRPADGIGPFATGPGTDRGGINWGGACYRVMGESLVSVDASGAVTTLGDVGPGGPVTLDYSFDCLAVWSGGRLYYWDHSTLVQVLDPDLGRVIDGRWIAGYFMSTDGTSLVVTELNDRMAVNPLKYGSAESDPDPVLAVDELRNEAYALGRYTIEVFDNVGGTGFPFARIAGAQIQKGIIGTHAYAEIAGTFAFVGGGRNEPAAVYLAGSGSATKISTSEIDQVLLGYSEAALAGVVVETKKDKGHEQLLIHLPDQCLVYDLAASLALKEPVWFTLASSLVGSGTYRARGLVRCYDRWIVGDPTSNQLGTLADDVATHYGASVGWEFATPIVYNEGRGAIFHELELVALPGRCPFGAQPTVWTSYTLDGETWSQERAAAAGGQGQRDKRIVWRGQGKMSHWRVQRFRGTSDAPLSVARLQARLESLNA